jgi:hypothetical protein
VPPHLVALLRRSAPLPRDAGIGKCRVGVTGPILLVRIDEVHGGLTDPYLLKPFVRVHVVDTITGRYLQQAPQAGQDASGTGMGGPGSSGVGSSQGFVRPAQYPGAPPAGGPGVAATGVAAVHTSGAALTPLAGGCWGGGAATLPDPRAGPCTFVMPQDSQPCLNTALGADAAALRAAEASEAELLHAALGRGGEGGSVAVDVSAAATPRRAQGGSGALVWREPLVFEVPLSAVLHPHVAVLFELLDDNPSLPGVSSASSSSAARARGGVPGATGRQGLYRIAWGFLKPVARGDASGGGAGGAVSLNVDLTHGAVPLGFFPDMLPASGVLHVPGGGSAADGGRAGPSAGASAASAAAPEPAQAPLACPLARLSEPASIACQLYAYQEPSWADRASHAADVAAFDAAPGMPAGAPPLPPLQSPPAGGGAPAPLASPPAPQLTSPPASETARMLVASPTPGGAGATPGGGPASGLHLQQPVPAPEVLLQYRMRRWRELPAALHVSLAPALVPAVRYVHPHRDGSGATYSYVQQARDGPSQQAGGRAGAGASFAAEQGAGGDGDNAPSLLSFDGPVLAADDPTARAFATPASAAATLSSTPLRRAPTCLHRYHPALGRPGYAVALPTDVLLREAIGSEGETASAAPARAIVPRATGACCCCSVGQQAGSLTWRGTSLLFCRGWRPDWMIHDTLA